MTDPRPTDAELQLLRILWSTGPCTVREVHRRLEELRETDVAYTTVLKLLQVMHDKGLVARDTSERSHVYTPTFAEEQVTGALVDDLVRKAFDGSASRLVMRALADRPTDPDEIAEIRALLDRLEER
ncbi:MAG: BlaI/MecI/CopY family transcriptional regulator [Alphaproteobacteria bacterium]|nr:BlaI/MecI/CopY family transcriptional regulator [Alphaproteobacteria bacterium]